jgi:tetratricopeptide (TPR) repeat protein
MICTPEPQTVWRFSGGGLAAILLVLGACSEPAAEIPAVERAKLALSEKDGLGAEIILRDMLARGTPMPEISAFLGQAELQQNNVEDARRWLEGADFTPGTRGLGYHMLGRVELAQGHLPEAGEAFDLALQSMPENPELWVDIGRLRYLGGEHRQAVDASIQAIELGPENVAALQFRAQLLRDAEGLAAALPLYEAALKRNPDSLVLLGDYAATLGEFGRSKDMLIVVRRMVELDEDNPRVFFLQAVLAARGSKFDLARNLLIRSGDLERGVPAAAMLSGIIDLEKGNYASASQTFDRLERLQPDNHRIRLLLARSLALGGNHRELIYRFKDRASTPGTPPYLTTLVGRSYEALGQRDNAAPFLDLAAKPRGASLRGLPAQTTLDVALSRGSGTGRDTVSLVRGLIAAGQASAAVSNAEAFLARVPGSGDALALAGDTYLAAGQGARAADYYAQAAAIRQTWPLTRRMVAAENAAGRFRSGLTLLEYQLADNSANSEAAVMLASADMVAGNARKASLLLDLAIANGASRDPNVQMLRARTALELGDMDIARKAARRAYSLQRMNPDATALLAEILTESGEDKAQIQALTRKAAKLRSR